MLDMQQEILYQDISNSSPFIARLKSMFDWEIIANRIDEAFPKVDKSKGGRPPYPTVLMLKIVMLQEIYGLSDERTEEALKVNIAYKYFCDLDLMDKVPDRGTIWHFKEKLCRYKAEEIFTQYFQEKLASEGIEISKGSIVDASFVKVPIQRNSKDENEKIKKGEIPQSFSENPHKLSQKDTDARWTKKNNKSHYGYKNHISIDPKSGYVNGYAVTSAEVHDSQVLFDILPDEANRVFGDSAYRSNAITEELKERKCKNYIQHRKYKNKPLTDKEQKSNKWKSKTRARVEHVFARFRGQMHNGLDLNCIGIERVKFRIGMRNNIYNMLNYMTLNI